MKILFKFFSHKVTKQQNLFYSQNNLQSAICNTLYLFFIFFSFQIFSQEKDTTKVHQIDEVLISAIRVNKESPVTFSNLDKNEIATRNLGQDIPVLMNFLPSVITTSDAGNGFGYTGIRVRGSDATRVNVTINGIPYNDSESSGTYFVDMPDFASSVESVQLQRGVGTSTNGSGAFGASLNMLTDSFSKKSFGEISSSIGSFNSQKNTVKFSTGLINAKKNSAQGFELAGRISNLKSDGYIDRAISDLKSYFFQGTYVGKSTLIKTLIFGGKEITYQAWNGIDLETLEKDRTFNSAGMFTDEFGMVQFYDNEVDNYKQNHLQLHWNEKISMNWNSNIAFHYTKGKGFYENYKEDADFFDYALIPVGTETTTDLVRQKWLDNDFYGTTFSLKYQKKENNIIIGGAWNKYRGKHFGEVVWAKFVEINELDKHYYDYYGNKTDGNIFLKNSSKISSKMSLFSDLQFRYVKYNANGVSDGSVNDNFKFFNPKTGLNYFLNNKNTIYFSVANANREPNRDDYENGTPKSEQLTDYELGWRYYTSTTKLSINGYYMKYKNQLVLTGALNDVGSPIRENVGNSYRIGLEIDASIKVNEKIYLKPNLTLSQNRNKDFIFQRDGVLQNIGNTNIAFSPKIVAANQLIFIPIKNLKFVGLTKYVGEQFMGNIDSKASKLKPYAVNDFNISYKIETKIFFDSIIVNGLINNIFNYKYESNGYFYTYDDDFSNPGTVTTIEGTGYYPQAGRNFLFGITLKY